MRKHIGGRIWLSLALAASVVLGVVPALAQTGATEDPEGVAIEQRADSGYEERAVEPRAAEEDSLDVVYVSKDGNDETGDGSKELPVATLSKAVQVAADNGTIYVMSDLTMTSCARYYGKDLTITSGDGGPYTITRDENFAQQQDTARSTYNPAMIEVGSTDGPGTASLVLSNIVLDDNGTHEGEYFIQAQSSNGNTPFGDGTINNGAIVQDAMIATYNGTGDITLGEGAVLKNFGGMSAIRMAGGTLTMESGSKIIDDRLIDRDKGTAIPGADASYYGPAGAVWVQGGTVNIDQGAFIGGMNEDAPLDGRAIYLDGGYVEVNGTIQYLKADADMWWGRSGTAIHVRSDGQAVLGSTGVIDTVVSDVHAGYTGAVMTNGDRNEGESAGEGYDFEMKAGSVIRNVSGFPALFSNYGNELIDGTIESCTNDYIVGGFAQVTTIGSNGLLQNNDTTKGAAKSVVYTSNASDVYMNGTLKGNKVGTAGFYIINQSGGGAYLEIGEGAVIEGAGGNYGVYVNASESKCVMNGGTISGFSYGVNCRGKSGRDATFVMNGGTITDNSYYGVYFNGVSNSQSICELNGGVVEDNGNAEVSISGGNAEDAYEHVKIASGVVAGNRIVSTTPGDVTFDEGTPDIQIGQAKGAAADKIEELVLADHADWEVVGNCALWMKPSTESVHFTFERPYNASRTTMYVAYIPVGTDGLPADGAQLTLVKVENTDPVDITLEGLTPGQSYAMMLVNTNIYQLAPDDVTIYTGGGQGQETSDNGFPTPTFTDSLDDIKTLEIDGKEVQSDDLMGELLKLFTVTYTDAEGNPVTNDAEAGEYTMTLQWADGEHEVRINGSDVADEFGTGVLTVRYVENIDEAIDGTNTHELLDDEPTELVEHAEAIANDAPIRPDQYPAEFYTNDDEDRQVAADGIQILDDDLLVDEDGTDRQDLLEQRAVDEGVLPELDEGQAYRFDFHYLDLVDAYNGNAWVSASYGTTVYLPYPDEMTYDEAQGIDFTVVHYPELHREYGFSGEAEVVPAIEACVPEVVEAECTPQGIKFNVPREGFSPYAIVWQTDARTITATADEGSAVTPAGTFTVSVEEGKTFSIEAKENYAIADVTLNGVSVLDQVKDGAFTVPASEENQELVVTSRSTLHTITATAGEGGTITPSGDVTVSEGDGQTFTITPNDGYVIADVKVDGESVGRVDSYAFDGVTEDHSIEATFETESAAPHEHVWSDWKCDGETHWKVCEVCGAVSERAEHTYGDWEQVSEATESEKGQWVRTCTVCGYEQHGTTPATEPDGSGMPETGDRTPTVPTGVLAACGAALIAGTVIYRRRHDA